MNNFKVYIYLHLELLGGKVRRHAFMESGLLLIIRHFFLQCCFFLESLLVACKKMCIYILKVAFHSSFCIRNGKILLTKTF